MNEESTILAADTGGTLIDCPSEPVATRGEGVRILRIAQGPAPQGVTSEQLLAWAPVCPSWCDGCEAEVTIPHEPDDVRVGYVARNHCTRFPLSTPSDYLEICQSDSMSIDRDGRLTHRVGPEEPPEICLGLSDYRFDAADARKFATELYAALHAAADRLDQINAGAEPVTGVAGGRLVWCHDCRTPGVGQRGRWFVRWQAPPGWRRTAGRLLCPECWVEQ